MTYLTDFILIIFGVWSVLDFRRTYQKGELQKHWYWGADVMLPIGVYLGCLVCGLIQWWRYW